MERRAFFKGAAFAITGLLTPKVAMAEPEPPQNNGAVDLRTIAVGPFVSVVNVIYPGQEKLFTTVRVKIRNEVYDFNRHGDIYADIADAEAFIRKAGFKHWIDTRSVKTVEYCG